MFSMIKFLYMAIYYWLFNLQYLPPAFRVHKPESNTDNGHHTKHASHSNHGNVTPAKAIPKHLAQHRSSVTTAMESSPEKLLSSESSSIEG